MSWLLLRLYTSVDADELKVTEVRVFHVKARTVEKHCPVRLWNVLILCCRRGHCADTVS